MAGEQENCPKMFCKSKQFSNTGQLSSLKLKRREAHTNFYNCLWEHYEDCKIRYGQLQWRLRSRDQQEVAQQVFWKNPHIKIHPSPVSCGGKIHPLHLCREVRSIKKSNLDMTWNYLMAKPHPWRFKEWRVSIHCHCSRINSDRSSSSWEGHIHGSNRANDVFKND